MYQNADIISSVPSDEKRQDQYIRGYHAGYPKGYYDGYAHGKKLCGHKLHPLA